jgi:hypothetical protein
MLGEKLSVGPADWSPGVLGLCREPFFSRAVEFVQLCWVSVKGCHVWGLSAESVRVAYLD